MKPYPDWHTLRELDLRCGHGKGAAFRAFKRLAVGYAEGRDYVVLQAPQHRATIDALRAQGRIYNGSVRVVLLADRLAESVAQALRTDDPEAR